MAPPESLVPAPSVPPDARSGGGAPLSHGVAPGANECRAARPLPHLRRWLNALCWLGAIVVMMAGTSALAAETVLRVLSWPGYADADVVAAFERRSGAKVRITLIGSDDHLRERMRARDGGDFDVVAANTAEIERFIARGLVLPIDPANIPNIARQLPRFRDLRDMDSLVRDGRRYAVPYTYSEMGLIFDRRAFPQPPARLADLWDERYRGRVLAYDGSTHNFSLAAIKTGGDPFLIPSERFAAMAAELVALRRNVLTFYTLPEESVQLFLRHEVVLMFANYGTQQLKMLQDAGADVGYVIPQEGTLAWLDCWAISRGVRDRALAEAWIDHMTAPEVGRTLSEREGLANTVDAALAPDDDERIFWLEPVEDDDLRARLWRRIAAGDRLEVMLQ